MAKENYHMDCRMAILDYSLQLEKIASVWLCMLLRMDVNMQDTKSFGYSSSALSFSQKINLLIDIGALSNEVKNKFVAFMEIRNKFMHAIDVDSYLSAYNHSSSKGTIAAYLKPPKVEDESQAKSAILALADDVTRISANVIERVKEVVKRKAELDAAESSSDSFFEVWRDIGPKIDQHLREVTKGEWPGGNTSLMNVGSEIQQLIFTEWKKEFQSRNDEPTVN